MKMNSQQVAPDEFILSVLSPEKRLDAAFRIAKTAFEETNLTVKDIQKAVKKIRKKIYAKK